jgi:hypothetical protein
VIRPPEASSFLIAGFVGFALALALGLVWLGHVAGRRAGLPPAANRRLTMLLGVLTAVWLSGTWMVAASGAIAQFDQRPPPMAMLFLAVAAVSVGLGFGPFAHRFLRGLPLWALVLTQAFRLPLELLMHEAAIEGVMPFQMSYSGRNFDILTGATAIPVACLLAVGYGGRRLAAAWNTLGTLLLANILFIAVISTPVFAAFGPARLNTWVAYPPFVWLPTVMVVCALAGHILIWRHLLRPTTTRLL